MGEQDSTRRNRLPPAVSFVVQPVDTRPFAERNAPHEFELPRVVERVAHVGVDAELCGAEKIGPQLNHKVRAAGGTEWRYWPDLKCTVRAGGRRFYIEVKTRHKDTGKYAVEWAAYQAQMELAAGGMRIVWLFDNGMACWIDAIEWCSPVMDGVVAGRTSFRLMLDHGQWLRPLEQFLSEEFGCSPTDC